ncbi:MAG TPA: hypothetical protein PKD74_02480, partial [Candidatus Dependentiae bacterium]|nr:hypothetical protein [Candidatus Dependentiae bacterium]
MKKCMLWLCAIGAVCVTALSAKDDCCCKVLSHTTFVVMPQYQTATPERIAGFRNRIGVRKDGIGGALEMVPLGGKSLKSSDLAQFFMPSCKNMLSVSNNFKRDQPDLLSEHFNIYPQNVENGTFNSSICLEASQAVAGVGLTYRQAFWELPGTDNMVWFEISGPLLHVRNKVRLYEEVSSDNTELMANGLP